MKECIYCNNDILSGNKYYFLYVKPAPYFLEDDLNIEHSMQGLGHCCLPCIYNTADMQKHAGFHMDIHHEM